LHSHCAYLELGISIDAAYTLARLLVRSRGPLDQYKGRQILLLASQLGSAKATLFVVKTAVKKKQLKRQEVQPSLRELKKLLEQDPPIIAALVAQAKIHEEEQEFEEAEELYRRALQRPSTQNKPSSFVRFAKQLQKKFSAEDSNLVKKKKITVGDNDPELDVVAAHLGLAQVKYSGNVIDHDEAFRHWKIAALEHDDPVAYYKLAMHLEWCAIRDNKDKLDSTDPIEHNGLRFVPYSWYEYMMKAAASGHAEAGYKIGLFYMLDHMEYANKITDHRLRHVLTEGALRNEVSRDKTEPDTQTTVGGIVYDDTTRNLTHVVDLWLRAAYESGCTAAYLPRQLLLLGIKRPQGFPYDEPMSAVLWVATHGTALEAHPEDKMWSPKDQENAIMLYRWLMKTERGLAIVRSAREVPQEERSQSSKTILDCLKKLPTAIQQLG
jgi:tetratricopeptide (TPR) repeat protein